jgi:hypothetical protein
MLHIDIPTLDEFKKVARVKGETCVSLYMPTSRLGTDARINRLVFKDLAGKALAEWKEAGADKKDIAVFEQRVDHIAGADRHAAHAATAGAVDRLLVDLDATVPGLVSDLDGSVIYSASDDSETYSVVDEVARRALSTGARVMAAKKEQLPNKAPLAASLRYQLL